MNSPKIKRMNWFVKMITFGWPIGISLAPFGIYIRVEYMGVTRIENHERIHWEQQMEMLILPFYLWYLIEWLVKVVINGRMAYISISFEQEAVIGSKDYYYMEYREPFAWWKYLKK